MNLITFAISWMVGIAAAEAVALPWQILPVVILLALMAILLWRDRVSVRLGGVCLIAAALGAGRLCLARPNFDEHSLATYNDVGWVTLEGVIVGEPDEREAYTNLRVRTERLTLPDGEALEVSGRVLIKAQRYPRRRYGDHVRVEGKLETPPVLEGFSYRDYLARQGVHSMIRRARVKLIERGRGNPLLGALFRFKRYAQSVIGQILPEPQAALLTGILLGVETGIPADLMDDFAATGTTHIIAISGFNITIISGIFAGLAERAFGKRRSTWVAIAGVAVYTIFVGASAAVVRAALMGMLYLWGRSLGRSTLAPVSLFAAAMAMTMLNPYTLWDVGFQLSFAATLGLILYTEPVERAFRWILEKALSAEWVERVISFIEEALIVTLAAQITTLPIILYTFGRLSLITLVTNFLILPVQSGVMIFGGIATMAGLVIRPVGQALGWIAWVFLTYTIEMVRLTAQVPLASVPAEMSGWLVCGYYALLGGVTWWSAQDEADRKELRMRFLERWEPKVLIGAAVVLLVLVVAAWRTLPDGNLHLTFLDVGQGDAIFIETPSGRQVLIDGGPNDRVLLSRLGRQMPFWDRSIDMVILTHPDSDHINGLIPVLERYRVDVVVHREIPLDSETYATWLELLELEGASIVQAEAGMRMVLDEGVGMTVLHPGPELVVGSEVDVNNNSVVTQLTYGTLSALLTGDIEAEVERHLVMGEVDLTSTLLKAAHHGSCSSTTEAFLDAVSPKVVVVSVGAENRFGHPCDDVLQRLNGVPVYRTDERGTVEIVSDGTRTWVETQR